MPLINGQKMACEPCIRGHRSTKCTHANERLMVPVRKPGRPLSSCPHPTSKPCSCGSLTAAISRKQKCGCGPSSSDSTEPKTEADDVATITTPPADAKATNPSYRVQKTSNKGHTARKQSVGAASLERMDASQLNILPSYDGLPGSQMGMANGSISPGPAFSSFNGVGIPAADATFGVQPMMYPVFPHPMPSPMFGPGQAKVNGHAQNGSATPVAEKTTGSCCGGKANTNGHDTKSPSPSKGDSDSATETNGINGTKKNVKSCCAPVADSPDSQNGADATTTPQPTMQTNGAAPMIPPFQMPMPMPNGMYPFYPQPTVFTYPPQYGSYMHPLLPDQWKQMMAAALAFGQAAPVQGFDMTGTAPAAPAFQQPIAHQSGQGVSHHCSCGDGCQCVGCAAHPYNDATQDYVRSAWNSMMEDNEHMRPHSHGNSVTNGVDHAQNDLSGNTVANDNGSKSATQADGTTTEPQTPSDAPSGLSEEQTLSANDFFFVTYPFGETCAGETASCPCGDDCQCIGCAIHSNPIPEETA